MNKEKLITENTCKHCGHRGIDVGLEVVYIGGKGYVPVMVCNDSVKCWQKWSEGSSLCESKLNKRGVSKTSPPEGEK